MARRQQSARSVCPPRRREQCGRTKGGDGIDYSGHKHQKGEKSLTIVDNRGNILAPCVLAPVNINDCPLLPPTLNNLTITAERVGLDLGGSFLTLDAGFYSQDNHQRIEAAHLFPVIKPNHRNTNDSKIIAEREAVFREVEPIYRLRNMVELQFAWEDKYRRLVVRYEKKQQIARGWRLLAASLVNFRECFGRETYYEFF